MVGKELNQICARLSSFNASMNYSTVINRTGLRYKAKNIQQTTGSRLSLKRQLYKTDT